MAEEGRGEKRAQQADAEEEARSRRKKPLYIDTDEKERPKPPEAPRKREKRPPSPLKQARGKPVVRLNAFSECVPLLKAEGFFTENAAYLRAHPFIKDMEQGKLSTNRARKFVAETFYVLRSDMRSFELAYELHLNTKEKDPSPTKKGSSSSAEQHVVGKYFEFMRLACSFGCEHLGNFQKALKLTDDDMAKYEVSPRTQCYAAYLSWLVTHTNVYVIAVCYALLYPVWAEMCAAMAEAVRANPKYRLSDQDVSYFRFYAEPLDDMQLLVDEILKKADADTHLLQQYPYKKVKDSVRLLQTYLVEFWDGVYQGAYCA